MLDSHCNSDDKPVLHEPILFIIHCSVADNENTKGRNIRRTIDRRVDSTCIHLMEQSKCRIRLSMCDGRNIMNVFNECVFIYWSIWAVKNTFLNANHSVNFSLNGVIICVSHHIRQVRDDKAAKINGGATVLPVHDEIDKRLSEPQTANRLNSLKWVVMMLLLWNLIFVSRIDKHRHVKWQSQSITLSNL